MIIGTCIVSASFYYYRYGGDKYAPGECNNNPSNVIAGVVIYSSYLYLFLDYALRRFLFGGKSDFKDLKAKKSL